jgi:hypothetical protein
VVLAFVGNQDFALARLAAAILWALAPSISMRSSICRLKGVAALHHLLESTLQVTFLLRHFYCHMATPICMFRSHMAGQ